MIFEEWWKNWAVYAELPGEKSFYPQLKGLALAAWAAGRQEGIDYAIRSVQELIATPKREG
jgi:hypothetical protein